MASESVSRKTPRMVGWQGLTLNVPENWDLTGFSGTSDEGYVRIDDSEEQSVEIKWATEPAKSKTEPDPDGRREIFFNSLRKRAKREKLALETNEVEFYRPVQMPDRNVAPFRWTGDRRGIGAVWYCRTCRRVVIAQVLGERAGKGGLNGVAEAVLGSLRCHGSDDGWRTWSLYGLTTQVPSEYQLESQQLMNVYLRLSFSLARSTARLSVEQWSLANMARRGAYLDSYVAANAKGELREARYDAIEGETVHGHPTVSLDGGLKIGMPMINAMKQMGRLQRPATQFHGCAWECEPSNSLYLIESLRPPRVRDVTDEVASRTLCHSGRNGG